MILVVDQDGSEVAGQLTRFMLGRRRRWVGLFRDSCARQDDMLALIAMLTLLSRCSEVGTIATLTIRGLDPDTHARLRIEAARHGRSMEAEVRAILTERLAPSAVERGLGSRIHARFVGLEGELQIPDRSHEPPRAAVFGP